MPAGKNISTGFPKAAGKGEIEVKGTITLAGNWKYADQTPKVTVRVWIPGSILSEYKITVDTKKNPHEFSGKLANLAPGVTHYVTAEIRNKASSRYHPYICISTKIVVVGKVTANAIRR